MKRTMVLLVLVEESDETSPIDVAGADFDELSRVVPRIKPTLAKAGELVQLPERRAVRK